MRLAGAALLAAAGLGLAGAAPAWDWGLPRTIAAPQVPADNPMSAAKVELGRRLFYDADLSIDGTLSCASCHEQHRAFADGNATHPGVRGEPGRRNVMGLANVGYIAPLTWADPTQDSLDTQAATPVFGHQPVEMGMKSQGPELVRRLSADACYRQMFAEAFPERGGQVSFQAAAKAIAAFERTMISFGAPYDRGALSPAAQRGEAVFRTRGCDACHAGPLFTDGRFHVIAEPGAQDQGLAEKTGRTADRGAFRTPSLRNAELTYPYLHDGSAPTIRMAIFAHEEAAASLSQDEAGEIEAFLVGLTDTDFVKNPKLALPRTFCGKPR